MADCCPRLIVHLEIMFGREDMSGILPTGIEWFGRDCRFWSWDQGNFAKGLSVAVPSRQLVSRPNNFEQF